MNNNNSYTRNHKGGVQKIFLIKNSNLIAFVGRGVSNTILSSKRILFYNDLED